MGCTELIAILCIVFIVVECFFSAIPRATPFSVTRDRYCRGRLGKIHYSNAINNEEITVWDRLSEWFQGDFDNYAQVVEDRENGLLPRDGGGHEHLHCKLIPVGESARLAVFFFDGNPDRIFRFRHYELLNDNGNDNDQITNTRSSNGTVQMRLNQLNPDLEKLLRKNTTDPTSLWPAMFDNFQEGPKTLPLSKCDISWSFESDPIQHSYLSEMNVPENEDDESTSNDSNKLSLHAVMIYGIQVVNSTIIPGMKIRIIDQLSLYQDAFYINDRGFDPITGAFIYGNQRNIPYRLERVSNIVPCLEENRQALKLQVTNSELKWTLGPNYRTTVEYDGKLNVVGGPTNMNKKK